MRILTTRVLAIFIFFLIVSLKPVHAQEIKVPDVHDGTWLLLRTENYNVPISTSPTTQTIFTIGTTRIYQHIGNSMQVTQIMPLHDPSQPVLTAWHEEKTAYYALKVGQAVKIGTQLNVTIDNYPCPGLWMRAFINIPFRVYGTDSTDLKTANFQNIAKQQLTKKQSRPPKIAKNKKWRKSPQPPLPALPQLPKSKPNFSPFFQPLHPIRHA